MENRSSIDDGMDRLEIVGRWMGSVLAMSHHQGDQWLVVRRGTEDGTFFRSETMDRFSSWIKNRNNLPRCLYRLALLAGSLGYTRSRGILTTRQAAVQTDCQLCSSYE